MRRTNWAALLTVAALVAGPVASPSSAQDATSAPPAGAGAVLPDDAAPLTPDPAPQDGQRGTDRRSSRGSFLRDVGGDFKRFFSSDDTLWTVGALGAGALFASPWDHTSAHSVRTGWSQEAFGPGAVAGNVLTHLAIGGGTYLAGRVTGQPRAAALGADLMRAQILSQAVIQAGKYATQRERPDASNQHSLPSGHAATGFATAAVIQRHFGWKAGIPAYAVASYIGASRMASNRHYLSDILLGAGIGIAAAHAVTFDVGARQFDLGVAPSAGGAAITVTTR